MPTPLIEKKIARFIARHHVMTLATTDGTTPWCCNLFYVFDQQHRALIFSSSDSTKHIIQSTINPLVGCSIVLESRVIARLQGAQITGRLSSASDLDLNHCRALYLRKFPFAALGLEQLWIVEIHTIKYTDNTLGFGKKIYFDRSDNQPI